MEDLYRYLDARFEGLEKRLEIIREERKVCDAERGEMRQSIRSLERWAWMTRGAIAVLAFFATPALRWLASLFSVAGAK